MAASDPDPSKDAQVASIGSLDDAKRHFGPIENWTTNQFLLVYRMFCLIPGIHANQGQLLKWGSFYYEFQRHLRKLRVEAMALGVETVAIDSILRVRPPLTSTARECFHDMLSFMKKLEDAQKVAAFRGNPSAVAVAIPEKAVSDVQKQALRLMRSPATSAQWNIADDAYKFSQSRDVLQKMRAAIDDVCSQPAGTALPADKLRGEKTVNEILVLLAAVIDTWRCPIAGIGPRFTDWMEHSATERRYQMLKDRVGRLTDDDLPILKGWLGEAQKIFAPLAGEGTTEGEDNSGRKRAASKSRISAAFGFLRDFSNHTVIGTVIAVLIVAGVGYWILRHWGFNILDLSFKR